MLKLRTRTQQTLVLIVTTCCAAHAPLSGGCETERAMKNAHKLKTKTFYAASALLPQRVF
jgi:hypothetical protein